MKWHANERSVTFLKSELAKIQHLFFSLPLQLIFSFSATKVRGK